MTGTSDRLHLESYAPCSKCGLHRPEEALTDGACADVELCVTTRYGLPSPRAWPDVQGPTKPEELP